MLTHAPTSFREYVLCVSTADVGQPSWLAVLRASLPGVLHWRQDAARNGWERFLPHAEQILSTAKADGFHLFESSGECKSSNFLQYLSATKFPSPSPLCIKSRP